MGEEYEGTFCQREGKDMEKQKYDTPDLSAA